MRKRNRKIKKESRFSIHSMGVAILAVTAFAMAMLYWSMDSRCSSISQEIGRAEKVFQQLEQECVRETTRWNALSTPERLQEKLTRFGLEMNYTRADQIVRMNADGRPQPGQIAVARAAARNAVDDVGVAQNIRPVRKLVRGGKLR